MRTITKLLWALLLLLFNLELSAEELRGQAADKLIPGAEKIVLGKKSDLPEYIQFRDGRQVPYVKLTDWAHQVLQLPEQYGFSLIAEEKDQIGYVHYRLRQTYNGLPMEGTMFIVHVKNGNIVSMNGQLFTRVNAAAVPVIDLSAALEKALTHVGAEVYRWQIPAMEEHLKEVKNDPTATWYPKGELMLAPVNGNYTSASYRLAYRFDIYAQQPLSREYVFIDAQTGEVIYTIDRINHANSTATAVTQYSGTQTMTTDSVNPTTFRLRETGRGQGIETYNLQQGTNYVNTDFTDSDNFWNNVNPQLDEYATDAHWGTEKTYDYFFQRYGRNSIDNNGFKLLSYIHYDVNFVNAFWDGSQMTYGDGDGTYTPLTSLDITAHEISHGLTEFTSGLGGGEAGSLNESFSDCMGNAIRYWANPVGPINWLIGDQIGGTPFRSMSDPNSYSDPDTYLGTHWDPGLQRHNNSTVMSHWFYLLTEGGSGTNDNGNSYNITGVGIDTAAAICFRMNTVYLFPNAEYADARAYAIQSAIDLYGPCTNPVIQTANAWYAVGLGTPFSPVVRSDFRASDSLLCTAPATINFQNLSMNGGSYSWDFGDGSPLSSTMNPSHTYNALGTYTVRLIADGGSCGIDTLTKLQYININEANPCIISLPQSSTVGQTQTTCSGTLYDNGGSAGQYTDNTTNSITIAPVGATSVTLTFSMFQLENNYDYLYVYDGPNPGAMLIGQYTGNTLPNGGTITSTGPSITIQMTSDGSVVEDGFALTWQCLLSTAPPVGAFSANTTNSCTGVVQFDDNSLNGPTSWLWDFGDSNTSTAQNPVHTYTTSGTYTVTLTVGNNNGNDVVVQSNYITVNLPAPPVILPPAPVCPNTSASITATGSGNIAWYDAPSGGTLVGSGNTFNTPSVNAPTTYYAQDEIQPAPVYGGPVDNAFGTGGFYTGASYRNIIFNCTSAVTLVSVKVYAQAAGNRTISLRQNGTTIQQRTINIPAGTSRITLNFNIPVGTNFDIGCGNNPNLYRNSAGASYPYNVGGAITLTGSNAGQLGFYYFFYDWEVREASCLSARTPVSVSLLDAPSTGFTSLVNMGGATFTDTTTGSTAWSWDFGDPGSGAFNTSTMQNPSHLFSAPGVYNVCLTAANTDGCESTTCNQVEIITLEANEMEANNEMVVYPNPATERFYIRFGREMKSTTQIRMTDVTGRIVHTQLIGSVKSNNVFEILTGNLVPGIYTVEVLSGEDRLVKQVVKE